MKRKFMFSGVVCLAMFFGIATGVAQENRLSIQDVSPKPVGPVYYLGYVGDGVVFFWESDLPEPNNNGPTGFEGITLSPVTEEQIFEFETGSITIPGGTIKELLELHVYVRQRYFFYNDGQDFFRARVLPIIELENHVFDDLIDPYTGEPVNGKLVFPWNGLMMNAAKSLSADEHGGNSRGNFRTATWTVEEFDSYYGKEVGKKIFNNDLTIRMKVKNWVQGLNHYVVGTMTKLYGR